MIRENKNGKNIWIDVESPTKDEVKGLMERFNLDPALADDIVTPGIRTKIDLYSDCVFLALYFPAVKHSHHKSNIQEIDFILGKNFLITIHYDTIDAINVFSKMFEVDAILGHSEDTHAGFVFYQLLSRLYESSMNELEYINDSLQHIETRIFKGEEKKVVHDLLVIGRDLIHFKQTIGAHDDVLSAFKLVVERIFDNGFSYHVDIIITAYKKIYKEIKTRREFLDELRNTNDSLLTTRQNETMRVFTMLALFTFPLSLIVSILSLPTTYRPIIGQPNDFFLIIGILVSCFLLMVVFFKNKHWM